MKVRIACVVSENGTWYATGSTRSTDEESVGIATDCHDSDGPYRIFFIEADVEAPKPTTVQGMAHESH